MKPSRLVFGFIIAFFGFLVGGAGAQMITEFSAGITAGAGLGGIAVGPDGNLWFTEGNIDRIGQITPDGVVTEFSVGISAGAHPAGIVAGPDGNLWFTEPGVNGIGRITPDGVVTEFSAGISGHPYVITAGPDGNLWFTESMPRGANLFAQVSIPIGRITPEGVVTEFSFVTGSLTSIRSITAGPDGNLWFTEYMPAFLGGLPRGEIWRITPEGVLTQVSGMITGGVGAITASPDGDLWFALGAIPAILRMTPQGNLTTFGASPNVQGIGSITTGPDGNVWFTNGFPPGINRITTTGVATHFSAGFTPGAITAGPDDNLWFTEPGANQIGRITTCCLPPPPTTTLVSSVNPSKVGQAIVFTASVAGNFPTGTVQFMDGATDLGSPVTLSGGGIAQLVISTLTKGAHSITALYRGDSNNAPGSSPALFQRVGKGHHHR